MTRYLALIKDAKTRIREISVDELRGMNPAPALLVDTREPVEWADGRIASAVPLPRGILEGKIEQLAPDLDQVIVLYCAGGGRSALAADSLMRMGYRNVVSLAGGFGAWQEAGYPVQR